VALGTKLCYYVGIGGGVMGIKILVVEDDKYLRNTVEAYLIKAGYKVDTCSNGDDALALFYDNKYQLIILDIMLPGVNGHELLKELRQVNDTPVLMMTALNDNTNEIRAFVNEADDYVTKPFMFEVFLRRVEALLRRSGALKKEIRVGKLALYPESYKVKYDGENIELTRREFDLLFLLVQNKGKIVSFENIITKTWGYNSEGAEVTVRSNIKRIRDKFPINIIKTAKGVGYSLEDLGNEV